MRNKLLQEGEIFELRDGDMVYTDIPRHFAFGNRHGDVSLTHHEAKVSSLWNHLQQRFVVTKTNMTGGGTGHGAGDVYHPGHHVWAKGLDLEAKVEIDFYQTGSFTAMIEREVEVLGRATLTWTEGKK